MENTKEPILYESLKLKGTKRIVNGTFCKLIGTQFEIVDEITIGLHVVGLSFENEETFYVSVSHVLDNAAKV